MKNNRRSGYFGQCLVLAALCLFAAEPAYGFDDPKDNPPQSRKSSKTKSAEKDRKKSQDEPPACRSPLHRLSPRNQMRRPAQSMPELFARMGEGFMRNPASGFNNWVEELSKMEDSALAGIKLTIDEERKVGLQTRTEYLRRAAELGYKIVDDPKRLDYLTALVEKAAKHMKNRDRYPTIEVSLIDVPIADGQSFPGGYLIFSTALLDEPDEATVFSVVAHELAHLDRGHLYQYARRSKLAGPGSGFSNRRMNATTFNQMFTQQAALLGMILHPYRPEHEHDADCWAVTASFLEGYDPMALAGFFERLHQRLRDMPPNPVFDFGRSHPYTLERRQAVVERLKQLRRWRKDVVLGRFEDELKTLTPKAP